MSNSETLQNQEKELITWRIMPVTAADLPIATPNSLGGAPFLADNQAWPRCEHCQTEMVLYLQLDLLPEFELPFEPHSHLLVFGCSRHMDPCMPPLAPALKGKLPENYREILPGDREYSQYKLLLNRPSAGRQRQALDPHLQCLALTFVAEPEEITGEGAFQRGSEGLKLGGIPAWLQNPETYKCSCGSDMAFLLQIPADYGFAKLPEAPTQPNSYGDEYLFFLGNEVYILACQAQCQPDSLWPIAQN